MSSPDAPKVGWGMEVESLAEMVHTSPLPTFDIQLALAQTLTWHRYRRHLDKRLSQSTGSTMVRALCEHTTRLQRLAEGLTAFRTTGVQEESKWFSRPCLEVFASHCLLQFGHVQHPAARAMTKDERVDAYLTHGDYVHCQLLKEHPDWAGHQSTLAERSKKIKELEAKLRASPFLFQRDKPWHGMDFQAALRAGLKSRKKALELNDLDEFRDMVPVMKDFLNSGIHGDAFAARFLHQQDEDDIAVVMDDRTPRPAREFELPVLLASYSLEMLAHEFGEGSLIRAMMNSARTGTESHPDRFIHHFPTATLDLKFTTKLAKQ